jgi:predicted Fe-S protein YdhL (DUF1289 family)
VSASTPCINVCTIDERSGFCLGCRRTLEEVAAWARLSEEERLRIMREELPRRTIGGGLA